VEPISVSDYETLAQTRMDPAAWGYFASGSDDEVTLRANHAAFERIQLRPRLLVDVSRVDTSTTVLSSPVRMPVLVAPTAYHCLATPEGEVATARAAGAAGTVMIASTHSTRSLEEIAHAATGPLWFQLYMYKDRAISEGHVRRAEVAGYQALVLTVDVPRLGRRERDLRHGFSLPPHLRLANFAAPELAEMPGVRPGESGIAAHAAAHLDDSMTWEAVSWLRSITSLPVLVKGILTAEDAVLAVAHGVAGLVVSNHGGRQLDTVPATIEALPEVADAVAGRCEVYLDGGIRRGTDVLKALALGVRAVLVGRPILWGLTADGEAGARRVLEVLRAELELAMALAGCPTVDVVTPALVRHQR
jgi:4-hydroxymandelate oxidase